MSLDTNTPVSSMTYNGTPLQMAAANAVLYTEQSLTDEQKEQARGNIGAASESSVVHEIPTATFKTGDNLLTDDIVTLGTGWSGSLATGFTHTAGNTAPLTFNINSADGERYIISGRFGKDVSAVHLAIGNSHPTDPYGHNPFVWGAQSVDGGSLTVTPFDKNWTGTIYDLECRKITDDGTHEVSVYLDDLAHEEMPNHIAGFWNIQMGVNALADSVNTTRCVAIGKETLCRLKTGGRNIGLGTSVLPFMAYGEDNIAIGADAGLYVEEAHGAIGIGKSAMSHGKKYTDCIAIGHNALYGATDAEVENNISIGDGSGYGVTTAKANIFIGTNAGYRVTTGTANTFIGSQAGAYATSWGSTAIGSSADTKGYSRSTAIGYNAAATKSHQVMLGGDNVTETVLKGNLIVRGTDGVMRQIVFNADGTCSWTAV